MVKESNNKIRLTGSWTTEIGGLDSAGKYTFLFIFLLFCSEEPEAHTNKKQGGQKHTRKA